MKPIVWAPMILSVATGCMRVDMAEVRVRDARAVGVVADTNNAWLLPPGASPGAAAGTAEVYRKFGLTASLARSDSGAIVYTSEHWALGKRVDTTTLLDAPGRTRWLASPAATDRLERVIARGGELRLHAVEWVSETGPFGTCNGTLFDSCITQPAVPMSLATDSANIEELRVVRTPMKLLGIGEVVLGGVSLSVGVAAGAALLPSEPSDARTIVLGVGAGLIVLGGLAIANGLWRLLAPNETIIVRPPELSARLSGL